MVSIMQSFNGLDLPDKPYYQDDTVVIYNADCRELLPLLPDKVIDLVLTDIPFNVDLDYASYDDKLTRKGYEQICLEWFNAMHSKAKAFIIKAPTKNMPVVLPIFDNILGYVWTLIQYSPNATTHGAFNLSLYTQYLVGGKLSKRPNVDVIVNTNNTILGYHPAEMPVIPIRKIIEQFTNVGDTILDPFMGSGTFIRAAKDLNRKAIGIEISENYCAIAVKRLRQSVMLFK